MQTLNSLKRKIDSVTGLESVVKTMKAMASVRIKQYEKAVESLRDYNRTVELALQAILMNRQEFILESEKKSTQSIGAVVYGSDQGMCGQLNDQILNHTLDNLQKFSGETVDKRIIVVGDRLRHKLKNAGLPVEDYIRVPGSVDGITPRVQEVLSIISRWQTENQPDLVWLFYSRKPEKTGFSPHTERLLPIDRHWVETLKEKAWTSRCIPLYTMDFRPLFSSLIRQYLFVVVYRAFAESMASENQSRLQSMQHAEKNIRDELESLNMEYHQRRQMSITEELLDIVSGFEALEGG